MDKNDWKFVAKAAGLAGLVVAVHDVTSNKWTVAHTVIVLVGLLAFIEGGGTAGL